MMETKPVHRENDKTPPPLLEAAVSFLTPRSSRKALLEDLREDYETSPQNMRYVERSARALARLIPGRAVLAFNAALVTAQAGALCASFAGASMSFALGFGLSLGLAVLVVRDGHTYPSETPAEAFLDALMAVTFVLASQVLIAVMASAELLPARIIVRGSVSSLMALSLLRMIFRRPDGQEEYGPRELAEQSYGMACRLNVIWSIAWVALMFTNSDAPVPGLDFFFSFIPILIVGMSYRRRQEGLSRPRKGDVPASIFGSHEKDELIRKRSVLWLPAGIGGEALFFAVVVVQFAVAVLVSPAVDWVRVGTNFTASLMLFIVWRYIRKANRTSAGLIQAEIDRLTIAEAR